MIRRTVVLLVAVALVCMTIPAYAGTAEWWQKAAALYKGVTIRGVSESTPPSKAVRDYAARSFEKLTGIKVEFEVTSWDEMYTKSISDISRGTGIYDFIYVEQDIIYAYLVKNWLTDMTEIMESKPQLTDPDLDIDDFTTFIDYFKDADGHVFGIPFEAFLKSYVYRKDLFEDAEIRAAFKAEYGWDLRPPMDWDEYTQIAKFFTAWGKKKGIELYGHVAQAKTHPCVAYEMLESIWPAWGIYNWGINLEKWRATVENGGTLNSKRAKEAFRWYVDMLKYAPPGVRTYTWDETAAVVGAGKIAQGLIYLENLPWIEMDASRSVVTGKIGVALPPTYPGIMSEAARGLGYIGYYDGGAFSIPISSRKKEAAWLFIQWATRKEWSPKFAELAGRVCRKSTFASPEIKALNPKLAGYYDMLRDKGFLYAGAAPLPMHRPLNEIYLKWVSKAIAGEVDPDVAVDSLAKEVDKLLVELGY
jgi:multiple sugar transport system substrate-binding protein